MQEVTDQTTSLGLLLAQWFGINVLAYFLFLGTRNKLETWIDDLALQGGKKQTLSQLLAFLPLVLMAIPALLLTKTTGQPWAFAGVLPFLYHPIRLAMNWIQDREWNFFGYQPLSSQSDDLAKALFLLGNVFLGFKMVTNDAAKAFDISWGFQLTFVVFFTGLFGLIYNAKDLWISAKAHRPSWKSWSILSLILVAITYFTVTQVPLQHRVLSDESSWESMGLQMKYAPMEQKGSVCNQGTFDENGVLTCFDRVNNFKGKFTPFVYYITSFFVEPSRDSALWVNLPIFILGLVFLFYGIYVLIGKESTALMAVVFMGTLPTMLFQARAASTEVLYATLFNALIVVFALLLPKFKMKHLWLVLPLLGMFAGTRLDTVFCFGALYFILWKFLLEKPNRLWFFTLGLILACLPSITVIAAYKGYDFQGGQYDAFSLYNFFINFSTNLHVMLGLERDHDGMWKYPFLTLQTIILYLGALYLLVQASLTGKHRFLVITGLLFFVQTVLIMVNVSGNFTIDINQRYVLVDYPLFAIICALFLGDLRARFFEQHKWATKQFWIIILASVFGVFLILKAAVYAVAESQAVKSLVDAGSLADYKSIPNEFDLKTATLQYIDGAWNQFYTISWVLIPFVTLVAYRLYKMRSVMSSQAVRSAKESWILLSFVIALNASLLWVHKEQFNSNIMYRHNGLLIEEKFLHENLRQSGKFPSTAVFVYARPWQMLCSRLNGISEDRLLSWTPQEWAEWNHKSGGHIYLVRGQDAWGDLNRGGRVVGFKTTEKAQQVLEKYDYEEILTNSELFGYPLTVYHLKSYKGMNPYRSQMILKPVSNDLKDAKDLKLDIKKFFAGSVKVEILNANQQVVDQITVDQSKVWTPNLTLSQGINALQMRITYPDGNSQVETQDVFVRMGGALLLAEMDPSPWAQEWGKPEKNRTVNSNPMKVKGRSYSFGVGTHAQSDLHYALGAKFTKFSFGVGLDDEDMGGDGVIYRVIADGKIIWESGQMFSTETKFAEVNVTGVQDLHLQVDRRVNKDFDHANWLSAWMAP